MSRSRVNLVVVAHPDDEILGFGGTGATLVAAGETVQPIILCGNADARTRRPTDQELFEDMTAANARLGFAQPVLGDFPNIRMNIVPHLELVQFIEAQIVAFQPDRIFTHHVSDLNDDHKHVFGATAAASRLFQRRPEMRRLEALYAMEIPSSTDWGFPSGDSCFQPNSFVEIGDAITAKIEALACYRNVMRDYPHPRSVEGLSGLAVMRGAQAGLDRAEAFQLIFSSSLR